MMEVKSEAEASDPCHPLTTWKASNFSNLLKLYPSSTAGTFLLKYLYTKGLREHCKVNGWCWECTLKPSKADGYCQSKIQWFNNKQLTLLTYHTISHIYANRSSFVWSRNSQISHLCNNPKCFRPEHSVYESTTLNNRRKNCVVYIKCPHSADTHNGKDKFIWLCPHDPPCIKYHPSYSPDEIQKRICSRINSVDG